MVWVGGVAAGAGAFSALFLPGPLPASPWLGAPALFTDVGRLSCSAVCGGSASFGIGW